MVTTKAIKAGDQIVGTISLIDIHSPKISSSGTRMETLRTATFCGGTATLISYGFLMEIWETLPTWSRSGRTLPYEFPPIQIIYENASTGGSNMVEMSMSWRLASPLPFMTIV
jgi:hypothetical protein